MTLAVSRNTKNIVADPTAYRFQMALITAIEAHVSAIRRTQFRALRYRDADFGRVIAVELYFRLINDAALRSAFDRHQAGEKLPDNPDDIPVSTVANWALQHMCGSYREPLATRRGIKDFLRGLQHRWKSGSFGKAPAMPRPVDGRIAFFALSRRYYHYLRPIVSRMADPIVWIVPEGADWIEDITAQQETYATYPPISGRKPERDVHGPIGNWLSTLRRYDDFIEVIAKVRPSVVVVVEGNNADDELLARAAATAGARSVCIQQGWSPVVHNGFRRMRFGIFCVWGEEFARMLAPLNRRQRFVVTGSHIVSPLREKANPDARDISIFLQKDSLLISNAAWLGMLDFISWCSRNWPDRQILVREHPAAPLNTDELAMIGKEPNIRLCRAQDMSLTEVMDRSVISVAIFSTTLIEAVGRHVVPLIVNVTGAPRYSPDLDALGAGVEVKDFDEAKSAVTVLFNGLAQRMLLQAPGVMNRFFAVDHDVALDNIAALIKKAQ